MEPLILVSGMALLLGLVFCVGYPLFTSRQRLQSVPIGTRSRQLQERKEQLYTSIKELEFDHSLGKLGDDDYQRLRQQLEGEALIVIQQLDELNGHVDGDALRQRIEAEVRTRRGTTPSGETAADRCPSCQAERRPGDQFCPQCGTRFSGRNDS